MSNERAKFVVGVDFGTTYSGVAFLHVLAEDTKSSDIEVIQTWPGRGGDMDNRNLPKAPTEISLESDGEILWGYQIPAGAKRYGWFKLLLDRKSTKTQYDDPNLAGAIDASNPNSLFALPPGKGARGVSLDYLRLLYEHVMAQLKERVPKTFDSTPIQFVLTTPAIWSHEAQSLTCDIAKEAGFGSRAGDKLAMVAEPEAAASYCLRELQELHKGSEHELQVGERILVCDAGGGTVDLVTYTVFQTSPCLRVGEATVGAGGKCGSTALDRAFLKWLESRVGKPFKKWAAKKTGRGSSVMMYFETAKKDFGTSSHSQTWRVPLGNVHPNPKMGIEDGEIKITDQDMAEIFDPVVNTIIELVAGQMSAASTPEHRVSKIMLVGGFGESQYLRKRLREWCESQPSPVDLISPKYPYVWAAVARGAVIHGLESIVDTRRLKQHYGVLLSAPFDPDVHDMSTVRFDPLTMLFLADDHVEWFAAKGKEAETGCHFPIRCLWRFPEWSARTSTFDLVGSLLDEAPLSAKRGKVHPVGQVKADLSSVPDSAFHTFATTCRGSILAANVTVDMMFASADIRFEVVFDEESYGNTQIEY